MGYSNNAEIEKAIERVLGKFVEKFIFVSLIIIGGVMIWWARDKDTYLQSILLNVGSNFVVFVFVFGVFQFFTGNQPGNDKDIVPASVAGKLADGSIVPHDRRQNYPSKPGHASQYRTRGEQRDYGDDDEAQVQSR